MRALGAVLLALILAAPAEAAFGPDVLVGTSGSAFDPPPEVGASTAGDYVVLYGNAPRVATRPAGGDFTAETLGTGSDSSLAVGASGAAVVAWRASAVEVKVAYRPNASAAFSAGAASLPGSAVTTVAAGIDDSGNAVVAYRDGGALKASLSSGGSFAAPETLPASIPLGFDGGGSSQLDTGPRAFRDNAGNVLLAYRSGNAAVVARRTTAGSWSAAELGPVTSAIKADADPASRRAIVATVGSGVTKVYEGTTDATTFTTVLDESGTGARFSVAVRPGATETLVVYTRSNGDVMGAGCRNAYAPAVAAGSSPSATSAAAALTTGHDGIAAWSSTANGTAPRANSRDSSGNWGTVTTLQDTNLGAVAAGADGSGGGLVAWVASGGQARASFYTGTPTTTATQCAAVPVDPDPTATPIYTIPTPTATATATASPAPATACATAEAALAKAKRALRKAKKAAKKAAKAKKKRSTKKTRAKLKRAKKTRAKASRAAKRAKKARDAACR